MDHLKVDSKCDLIQVTFATVLLSFDQSCQQVSHRPMQPRMAICSIVLAPTDSSRILVDLNAEHLEALLSICFQMIKQSLFSA